MEDGLDGSGPAIGGGRNPVRARGAGAVPMVPTILSGSTSPLGRPDQGMDRIKGWRWALDDTAETTSAGGEILGDLSGAIPTIAGGHAGNRLMGGAPAKG